MTTQHTGGKLGFRTLTTGSDVPSEAARMLRVDLEAAGVAYHDDQGRRLDFHSLRLNYLTMIGQATDAKTAQELARHASLTTTQRCLHTDDSRKVDALAALPRVPVLDAVARATGTDAAAAVPPLSGAHEILRHPLRPKRFKARPNSRRSQHGTTPL